MTCLYKGGRGSSCPKTVYRAKTAFQNSAIRHGERLTQYYNTPSCDKKTNFKNRYSIKGFCLLTICKKCFYNTFISKISNSIILGIGRKSITSQCWRPKNIGIQQICSIFVTVLEARKKIVVHIRKYYIFSWNDVIC